MTKITIDYKCGHNEYAPGTNWRLKDQESAQKMHGHKVCPQCYKADIEAKRAAEAARAAELAQELPALEGSEKQIAWAIKIRQEFIDMAEKYGKAEAGVKAVLAKKTKASAWIDDRDDIIVLVNTLPDGAKAEKTAEFAQKVAETKAAVAVIADVSGAHVAAAAAIIDEMVAYTTKGLAMPVAMEKAAENLRKCYAYMDALVVATAQLARDEQGAGDEKRQLVRAAEAILTTA